MAQFLLSNARKIILVNKQSQQINIARTILNNNSHNRRDVVRQALIKRSFFSTPFHFESHTMNVPSMGDSITEGTMVEWLKDVLASPVANNAQLEGEVYSATSQSDVTRLNNNTQISAKSFAVSGTQDSVDSAVN